MEKVTQFITENKYSILAGFLFYGLFLYYNNAGNSLCDCESTENYNPNHSGNRTSYNRFYHK